MKHTDPQEQESKSADEILQQIFHKPETQDWYKPVLAAMEIYRNQPLPDAPEHPEDTCQCCGGNNPYWTADNNLFNEVNGSPNGIVCPNCFIKKANELSIDTKIEKLLPAAPAQGQRDVYVKTENETDFELLKQMGHLKVVMCNLELQTQAPALPVQQGYSEEHLRTEFENNPSFEFAAENYWEVYAEWLEGKFSWDGWVSVKDDLPEIPKHEIIDDVKCTPVGINVIAFNEEMVFEFYYTDFFEPDITHWKYLPLPPKK